MFNPLKISPTFTTPVTVRIANDAGGVDESKFVAIWERKTVSQLDDIMAEREALKGVSSRAEDGHVIREVRKLLRGWKDVAVDFSEENVEIMLAIPQAARALHEAFWRDAWGVREKN